MFVDEQQPWILPKGLREGEGGWLLSSLLWEGRFPCLTIAVNFRGEGRRAKVRVKCTVSDLLYLSFYWFRRLSSSIRVFKVLWDAPKIGLQNSLRKLSDLDES
jgi:hypothetical protein